MAEQADKIFKLRFFDNGVTPNSFTVKELGSLLLHLDEGIKSIIENKYPEAEVDDVRISLIGVENQSESLIFGVDSNVTIDAVKDLALSIRESTYTSQPKKAYESFRYIRQLTDSKQCKAELVYKGEQLYVVVPDVEIIKQENVLIETDTVLYGELLKIGSNKSFKEDNNKTRAWVELIDGQKFSFPILKEQALELSHSLSKTIALKGKIKWNVQTKTVQSFKLYDVIGYKQGNVSKGFEQIRNITGGFWDTLKSDDDINRHFKGD